MLAIKFAAPHHVFLQQGYPTETMDGVLTTANKANTMYIAGGSFLVKRAAFRKPSVLLSSGKNTYSDQLITTYS